MNILTKLSTVLGLAMLGLAGTSHGALIDNGLTTLDDATSLEWLDVTSTMNMSYSVALTSTYVTVDGYRHATQSEIFTLYSNAGMTGIGGGFSSSNHSPSIALLSLLGVTHTQSVEQYQLGWYDNGSSGTSANVAELIRYTASGGFGASAIPRTSNPTPNSSPTSTSPIIGHYLVRSSVVPVPAAAWLFGSALIGLVGIKRKK
jgi:hypothetical protein